MTWWLGSKGFRIKRGPQRNLWLKEREGYWSGDMTVTIKLFAKGNAKNKGEGRLAIRNALVMNSPQPNAFWVKDWCI